MKKKLENFTSKNQLKPKTLDAALASGTNDFVRFVNQNQVPKDAVDKYLNSTLSQGYYIDIQPMSGVTYCILDNAEKTLQFFRFSNPEYVKMAKTKFLEFAQNCIIPNYKYRTVTRYRVGGHLLQPEIEKQTKLISDFFDFMVSNPTVFAGNEVEDFVNNYSKMLVARTEYPRELFKPYYVKSAVMPGALELVKSDTCFAPSGIYLAEMPLLKKMNKFLLANGLSTNCITNVLQLPCEDVIKYNRWHNLVAGENAQKKFVQKKQQLQFDMQHPHAQTITKNKKFIIVPNTKFAVLKKLKGQLVDYWRDDNQKYLLD